MLRVKRSYGTLSLLVLNLSRPVGMTPGPRLTRSGAPPDDGMLTCSNSPSGKTLRSNSIFQPNDKSYELNCTSTVRRKHQLDNIRRPSVDRASTERQCYALAAPCCSLREYDRRSVTDYETAHRIFRSASRSAISQRRRKWFEFKQIQTADVSSRRRSNRTVTSVCISRPHI